jgi:hypothetical protein
LKTFYWIQEKVRGNWFLINPDHISYIEPHGKDSSRIWISIGGDLQMGQVDFSPRDLCELLGIEISTIVIAKPEQKEL